MVKHECANCKKAKARIVMILQHSGRGYRNVSTDDDNVDKKGRLIPKFPAQKISEFLPEKDYFPDVYFEKQQVPGFSRTYYIGIIEVDHIEQKGPSAHKSKHATQSDRARDKFFLTEKGIPTIRFNLEHIVGMEQYLAEDILNLIDAEIKDQLHGKRSV